MSEAAKAPITNFSMVAIKAIQETSAELSEAQRNSYEAKLNELEANQGRMLQEIQAQGAEIVALRAKLAEIKQRRTGDLKSTAHTPTGGTPLPA